jgi:hypothetical protein
MRRVCPYIFALLSVTVYAQQAAAPAPKSTAPTNQTVPTPQQPATAPTAFSEDLKTPATSEEGKLQQMFETKIETEWEALRNKDRKAYGNLLADDYEGVEVDGRGERTKIQAINELVDSNIYTYALWGFKLIPLGSDAAMAIYEVTMTFPPRSVVHFSRLYITELWMKRAGEWQEVHYQETHVK